MISSATAGGAGTERLSRTEMIGPGPAEALAGLLDIELPSSEELPPLWHWVYLNERPRQNELGPDGHPVHGIPAPPGPGMLRMFAGGRVSLHMPLRFGALATRTTRQLRTVQKRGRSGSLRFVTVRSDFHQGGPICSPSTSPPTARRGPGYSLEKPGSRRTRTPVGHQWRKATSATGVTGLRLHDLRHFFASGLIASGCDVVTVQRALGHASATTTLTTYGHLWPDAEDRTRAATDGLMSAALDDSADSLRTGRR
jgi:hypothetical protein